MPKRQDYISWDEYFMGIALLSARRSKDPRTQVGACIVGAQNRIMSVGYNGLPTGLSDDEFPWEAESERGEIGTKYPYVCHAELNAILNSGGRSLEGCRIYVALFPCCECAKAIIQCGIREVRYLSDKHAGQAIFQASRRMFEAAGVKMTELRFEREKIKLDFSAENV
ncbi:MAG: dCMP deaminase family protein [Oscillospiraceae bacterium]|nr:dCMP deaminase family protein [Oscillospiraceae bacterium]